MLNLEKIIALIILIICIVYAYTSFVIMQANLLPFELNMTVLPNSLPKVISIFGIVISLFLILKKDEDIEKDEDQSKIDLNNVLNFYYGKALSIIFLMILYTLCFIGTTIIWLLLEKVLGIYMRPFPYLIQTLVS